MERVKDLIENFKKDWIRLVIIIGVTITTCIIIVYLSAIKNSFVIVFTLGFYVIFYLLIQLLKLNVVSKADKITFNVKLFSILGIGIFAYFIYHGMLNTLLSLITFSLVSDTIIQSLKIWDFRQNMVAVNDLVIYTEDKNEPNIEIPEKDVLEIISKIRFEYNYLYKKIYVKSEKIDVKAIDGEMANRVREIFISIHKFDDVETSINKNRIRIQKASERITRIEKIIVKTKYRHTRR